MKEDETREDMDLETILMKRYKKRMEQVQKTVEEYNELAEPINQEQFYEELKKQNPESTESYLRDLTEETFKDAFLDKKYVSKLDLIDLKSKEMETKFNSKDIRERTRFELIEELDDDIVIPKVYPLTPLPNFSEYDPEEYYNMKEDISHPIKPKITNEDQWFDIPENNKYKTNDGQRKKIGKDLWNDLFQEKLKNIESKHEHGRRTLLSKEIMQYESKKDIDYNRREKDYFKNYTEKVEKGKPFTPKHWRKGRKPKLVYLNRIPKDYKENKSMFMEQHVSDDMGALRNN